MTITEFYQVALKYPTKDSIYIQTDIKNAEVLKDKLEEEVGHKMVQIAKEGSFYSILEVWATYEDMLCIINRHLGIRVDYTGKSQSVRTWNLIIDNKYIGVRFNEI